MTQTFQGRRRGRAVGIATILAVIALVGLTWTFTRDRWADREFDRCQVKDGSLILSYTYGAGDDISTSFGADGQNLIVRLRANTDDGLHTAEARHGELSFQSPGPGIDIRDYNGHVVRCDGR